MTDPSTAFAETRHNEGGDYDGGDARDPNPTRWGVTQNTFTAWLKAQGLAARSVFTMTEEECNAIYTSYWRDSKAETLGPLSAPLYFDHAFNAGAVPAVRVLQRALGLRDDGKFGPGTASTIAGVLATPSGDALLANRLIVERLVEYERLGESPRLRPNLLSWVSRLTTYASHYLRPTA